MPVDFAELYRAHYRRVFGLCRRLLSSTTEAEDAAQEVFMRAYRNIASYDPAQPFPGWILGIATHYCIDRLRRRGKETPLFGDEREERLTAEADATNLLGDLLEAERASAVNAAVAALPERYRVPLVLAYYRDLSYDEVAKTLSITPTHAGALICRGKQMLRRTLGADQERRR